MNICLKNIDGVLIFLKFVAEVLNFLISLKF